MINLKRVLKSGWNNFLKDKNSLISVVSIMVIVLGLVTTFFLSQKITNSLIAELRAKMDVSVYFKKETPEEEILKVKQELEKLPQVKKVEYVSKDEALRKFKERYKGNPSIMESLEIIGTNPLLASLNIRTFEAAQYKSISSFLGQESYKELVDHSNYHKTKEIINKIFSFTSGVNTGMFFLGLGLAFIAVLMSFNIIRLAIINRKKEISVMRLVGAKNWFIRGPFVVQGALIGISSALITSLLFAIGLFFLSSRIELILPGISLLGLFASNFWSILLIQLLVGVGLTVLSSLIATQKYLRV